MSSGRLLRRGDGVIACSFINNEGELPVDPATVELTILRPDGETDEYTYAAAQITKVATGEYEKTYQFNLVGRYDINWVTTAPNIVVFDFVDIPRTPFD